MLQYKILGTNIVLHKFWVYMKLSEAVRTSCKNLP